MDHSEREGDPLALVSGNATYKYTAVGGSIYYLCGTAVCAGGAQTADTNNASMKCGTVAGDSETITTYQGFIMLDAATVDLQLQDGDRGAAYISSYGHFKGIHSAFSTSRAADRESARSCGFLGECTTVLHSAG